MFDNVKQALQSSVYLRWSAYQDTALITREHAFEDSVLFEPFFFQLRAADAYRIQIMTVIHRADSLLITADGLIPARSLFFRLTKMRATIRAK